MGKRQLRRKKSQKKVSSKKQVRQEKEPEEKATYKDRGNFLLNFYDRKYMLLMFLPFLVLLLAFVQIGSQYLSSGEIMDKGVSLEGGVTATIPSTGIQVDSDQFVEDLKRIFPNSDFNVRELSNPAQGTFAFIVEADIVEDSKRKEFVDQLVKLTGAAEESMNIDSMGPSLGQSFFRQTIKAMIFAFLLMGIVVFFYFRTFVPSIAVIISAFSDIVVTLAIANVLGMKMSTAGIAGFLMLIGYSIDTDILLTTRVLREKSGDVFERVIGAAKTGLTMSFSTIIALSLAIWFSQSEVLTQIMTIVLIGLLVDLVNTWLQNVGLLRWYADKKGIE
ncbi:MAG: protein translocase subunit SecF [Nanobdellota archaeon]